ncbi:hypothetical protein [Bacillus sp. R86525]|uniref:hypothetical protein n=1 Tax=Bacillus sp. R86525 TaxID=3101709 RepID=UPI0036711EF9
MNNFTIKKITNEGKEIEHQKIEISGFNSKEIKAIKIISTSKMKEFYDGLYSQYDFFLEVYYDDSSFKFITCKCLSITDNGNGLYHYEFHL